MDQLRNAVDNEPTSIKVIIVVLGVIGATISGVMGGYYTAGMKNVNNINAAVDSSCA